MIIDHNGGSHFCGQLGETPVVVVRFTTQSVALRFLLNPQVVAGEGYMRGEIVLEKGTVRDFWILFSATNNWRMKSPTSHAQGVWL